MASVKKDRGRHAETIIEARRARGMSQAQLAELVGRSPGAIAQLELGEKVLSEDLTLRIAAALQLSQEETEQLLATRRSRARDLQMSGKGRPVRPAPALVAEIERLDDELETLRQRVSRLEQLAGLQVDHITPFPAGEPNLQVVDRAADTGATDAEIVSIERGPQVEPGVDD